ncbi:hypothetical protein [Streptomyces albidoflavus]|uniref:hypothetical protein n=1 Tax=Streptomyces albidoflavus TaxID=1886 RepID=UPI0034023D34
MNCSTDACTRTALVREPLPLCRTCTLQVLANYANANLSASSEPEVRQSTAADEIDTLYYLLDTEGWNSLDLNRAMEVLNRPKATAARRLSEARRRYAIELGRRTAPTHTQLRETQ